MSEDLKLYTVFELDGDKHLIPKYLRAGFEKALSKVEESYDTHFDEDVYYEELDDLLSYFSKGCLEGEEHYVVLSSDLAGDKV